MKTTRSSSWVTPTPIPWLDPTGVVQRNEPLHQEKVTSLLDESLAISSELGMRPLMERVLSRREILKA